VRAYADDLTAPTFLESVAEVVTYEVPKPFLDLLGRAADVVRRAGVEADIEGIIGMALIASCDWRIRTPPEMFIFGWGGCDGVHYGHVNRAPEIAADDLPFAECVPAGKAIGFVGATAHDTWSILVTEAIENGEDVVDLLPGDDELAGLEAARLVARELRLDENDGYGQPVPVVVPPGYRHVPTLDGIGVLAPVDSFHGPAEDEFVVPGERDVDHAAVLTAARRHLQSHPASALVHYKNYFCSFPENVAPLEEMAACYERLGRAQLAAHVRMSAESMGRAAASLRELE
jgi:hypothetical protein